MIVVNGRKEEVIMTRKERLFADYEAVKDKAICVTLMVRMPGGEIEVISNSNVEDKMAYIDRAYDDDLVHANSVKIHIEDYSFERMDDPMDFGSAIMNMKEGHKVARKGWNGKGMFLYHVPAAKYKRCTESARCIADKNDMIDYGAYIAMKTAQGNVVPWLASQTDMLAEDWLVVE